MSVISKGHGSSQFMCKTHTIKLTFKGRALILAEVQGRKRSCVLDSGFIT